MLLLDEPTANLDAAGTEWYQGLIEQHRAGRTVVVASNRQEAEYEFCSQSVEVEQYK